jgi:hypothetical protein
MDPALTPLVASGIAKGERVTVKRGKKDQVRCQWLTPIILATQEAEIQRIMVQSQPGQIVPKTPNTKQGW